jgi:hypothetical protein
MPDGTPSGTPDAARSQSVDPHLEAPGSGLARALTFHASFDHGPDADFAAGDARIYTPAEGAAHDDDALTPGLGQPPLGIVPDGGRYGAALAFTPERSHVVVYKAARNVAYSPSGFRGTISFWMSLDPASLPGRYCDPLQVTDKRYNDACIWLDFTKNDAPPDLRLGVFGDLSAWNVSGRESGSEEFYWRLLKVALPPFAEGQWTHVAVTWDGVNTPQHGRAFLYLNGAYQGATGGIAEPFTWDADRAWIRLGTGRFVGRLDDLAAFDRPLTAGEVGELYRLEGGVAALRGA